MAEIEIESVAAGFSKSGPTYQVVLDGESIGDVTSGQIRRCAVTAGIHTVRIMTAGIAPQTVKLVVFGRTRLVCRTIRRWSLFTYAPAVLTIEVREEHEAPRRAVISTAPSLAA